MSLKYFVSVPTPRIFRIIGEDTRFTGSLLWAFQKQNCLFSKWIKGLIEGIFYFRFPLQFQLMIQLTIWMIKWITQHIKGLENYVKKFNRIFLIRERNKTINSETVTSLVQVRRPTEWVRAQVVTQPLFVGTRTGSLGVCSFQLLSLRHWTTLLKEEQPFTSTLQQRERESTNR